ncbi:MAG: class I SAM-dependent methyltransferase, partial [Ekhidna sp.]
MKNAVPNEFNPPWWYSFFFSSYLSRRALYKSLKENSHHVEGVTLDFGCGSKPYESIFNAEKYIGVDIQSSGHDHASSKVDDFYDGNSLPYPDESFNSIFSSEVFEHVSNIDEMILELNRVLKDGGKMLITIPFAIHEHEIPYDFRRFTTFGIENILNKNGFEIEKIEPSNHYLEAIFQLLIWYFTLSFKS